MSFFFYCSGDHRDLHSFPTRRSSDLATATICCRSTPSADPGPRRSSTIPTPIRARRSEEHTSELQSRLHLVCRLLLEKKKKTDSVDDDVDDGATQSLHIALERISYHT